MKHQIRLTKEQLEAWRTFSDPCWGPFREAWLERGFPWPPSGEATDDPETSVRSRLFHIAVLRPNDLGAWVRSAPRRADAHRVVGHVFRCWAGFAQDVPFDEEDAPSSKADREADAQALRATLARLAS